jgi:hypothetical protein
VEADPHCTYSFPLRTNIHRDDGVPLRYSAKVHLQIGMPQGRADKFAANGDPRASEPGEPFFITEAKPSAVSVGFSHGILRNTLYNRVDGSPDTSMK